MRELNRNEYALVFGGQTTSPKPRNSNDLMSSINRSIREGNYGTALGLMLDNPFTLIGNGLDSVAAAIGSINSSSDRAALSDALSKSQMPAG